MDKSKIVYWDSSFSGGNLVYAAAADHRIRAAIIQAPSVSGETGSEAFKDRIEAAFKDRASIVAGSGPTKVPLMASDQKAAESGVSPAIFPGLNAYEKLVGLHTCGGKWENYITAQTLLHMLEF